MKRRVFTAMILFLSAALAWCGLSFAKENEPAPDKITALMKTDEVREMVSCLKTWTSDPAERPSRPLTGDDVRKIYEEFAAVMVQPPDVYDLNSPPAREISPRSLGDVEKLGRKVQGIFSAMSPDDDHNYGKILGLMREVLYLDHKYLSRTIAGDHTDAVRWYELINTGMKEIEREYIRIAIAAWGVETLATDEAGENDLGEANMPDGSVYRGYFANGLFNGQGTRTWKDGHRYEGEYKDGLPHGKGVETMSDGTRYEGGFKDGKWYGKGTITWKDGKRYEVTN